MPLARAGQLNIAGITNPGAYVIENPPTPFAVGVPTNIEGLVGVASWGKVNAPIDVSNLQDGSGKIGTPQIRPGDLATHISAATQMGTAIAFKAVRVTDGTDTAATALIQSTAGQATAVCTGILGNNISLSFAAAAKVGAYAAIVQGPTGLPERFDNIFSGLQGVTVVPGSGYTSVPAAMVTAPQIAGGVQATVRPTLTSVTQTIGSGGSGYAINDTVTFGAGVQIKVLTVTGGAIATFQVQNPGSITSGAVPAGVGAQTATSGAGTGATLTLSWGLGTPTFNYGGGYYAATGAAIAITLMGGGAGGGFTAGTYTAVASFWAALATALNNGTTQRQRSQYIVYTPGTSTAPPTVGAPTALSGGTDGASGVSTAQLLGTDGIGNQRTGMYALRGSGVDGFALCDCTDTTIWGSMVAFGISEGAYPVAAAPLGLSIADTVALRKSAGIDDTAFKLMSGDWPTFTDSYFGNRIVSPTAIVLGLFGNLSPEQGTINKPLAAVVSTQTSLQGVVTASADEAVAEEGGIDLIGRSEDLGAAYFSLLTGRNASSNTAARGDEYRRLTNFLMKTYLKVGRAFVGKLQSQDQVNDPTRIAALQTFDSFCQSLVDEGSGSGGYGMINAFQNICLGPRDANTNNPRELIQRGYLFLTSKNEYLNVVRYFVINLFGGGNVSVSVQTTYTIPSA